MGRSFTKSSLFFAFVSAYVSIASFGCASDDTAETDEFAEIQQPLNVSGVALQNAAGQMTNTLSGATTVTAKVYVTGPTFKVGQMLVGFLPDTSGVNLQTIRFQKNGVTVSEMKPNTYSCAGLPQGASLWSTPVTLPVNSWCYVTLTVPLFSRVGPPTITGGSFITVSAVITGPSGANLAVKIPGDTSTTAPSYGFLEFSDGTLNVNNGNGTIFLGSFAHCLSAENCVYNTAPAGGSGNWHHKAASPGAINEQGVYPALAEINHTVHIL